MRMLGLKTVLAGLVLAFGLGIANPQVASAQPVKNINWSLLSSDPYCPHRANCHEQLHKVWLQAGKTYTIDMMSSKFDAYMFLENMTGQVLAQDDQSGAGNNARIVYTPVSSGYYNIVATSYAQYATGSYSIVVNQQHQVDFTKNWSLIPSDPFNPNRPGCHEQLHKVWLNAGTIYTIDMTSGQFDAYLFLENMTGQVLAQDDQSGIGNNAKIVFTPSVSGYYNVVATSYLKNATGSYQIVVSH